MRVNRALCERARAVIVHSHWARFQLEIQEIGVEGEGAQIQSRSDSEDFPETIRTGCPDLRRNQAPQRSLAHPWSSPQYRGICLFSRSQMPISG